MSSLKKLRWKFEVLVTRLCLLVLPRVPRKGILRLARCLGRVGYHLSSTLRRIGEANLDLAFGTTKSADEKRTILRQSYISFATVVLDVFWFTRNPRERLNAHVHFPEGALESVGNGPEIFITAHLGNWEVLGQAVANAGLPLHSVAAPMSNPWLDPLFIPSRELTGQRIVSSEGALKSLIRVLRDGQCFAMLLDQNTKPSEGGVFVPIFGIPAPVSMSAAILALRTDSEIVFGFALLQEDGSYRVVSPRRIGRAEIEKIKTEAGAHAADRLTLLITRILEDAVRDHPGSWLWTYKRWKHIAPGYDRNAYPHYAKFMREEESGKARVVGEESV